MKLVYHYVSVLLFFSLFLPNYGFAQRSIVYTDFNNKLIKQYDFETQSQSVLKQGPGDINSNGVALDTLSNRVYWVTNSRIYGANIGENIGELLYELPESGRDINLNIEYSYTNDAVYVSELEDQVIYQYDVSAATGSVFLESSDGIGLPTGLVATSNYLIWTSGEDYYRANLDGTGVEEFASDDANLRPVHLSADEANDWLYVSAAGRFGNPPALRRITLSDGSTQETLQTFSDDNQTAEGLSVLPEQGQLFWVSRVGNLYRSDLTVTNIDTLASLGRSGGDYNNLEVDVAADRLFWSGGTIISRTISAEGAGEPLFEPFEPLGVRYDAGSNLLIYTNDDDIEAHNLETGVSEVIFSAENGARIPRIELHTVTNTVYWNDGRNIYRKGYTEASVDTIVPGVEYNGLISGMAIDTVGNALYFTDNASSSFGSLRRFDLGNETLTTLIDGELDYARGLEIDTRSSSLFWGESATASDAKIVRYDLDGTNRRVIANASEDNIQVPDKFAVDASGTSLYWVDVRTDALWKSELDGSGAASLGLENTGQPVSVELIGGGMITSNPVTNTMPLEMRLLQNYPNPFNPTTTIQFQLSEAARVNLVVYDLLGREVAILLSRSERSAGMNRVSFDASGLASGVYLYRLKVGNRSLTRTLTLVK